MKKTNLKYLEPFVFFSLLILTFIFQWYSSVYLVKDFNWLAFIHHDLIYQIERFLLDMNFQGVKMLNSGPADYGSELWLLIPLYKLYEVFLSSPKPIHAYYFLTVIHLCCGIFSFILIRYLFKKSCSSSIGASLLAFIVLSSPHFVAHLSFIKPDPNAVLLCVIGSFLALLLFHQTGNIRWLFIALITAALGTAVKWWGIFMLFPIAYAVLVKGKNEENGFLPLKYTYLAVIIFFVILYITQIIAVRNTIDILNNRTGQLMYNQSFISQLPPSKKILYKILLFLNQKTGMVVSFSFTAFGIFVCYTIIQCLYNFKKKLWKDKRIWYAIINCLFVFSKVCSLFLAFFLILDVPFLLTEQPMHMLYSIVQSSIFGQYAVKDDVNVFANVKKWIQYMEEYGVLSYFINSGIFFSMYIYLKKIRGESCGFLVNMLLLYLIPLMTFLFLFVFKKSDGIVAMVFPLLILFIVVCVLDFLKHLSGYKTIATILVIVFFFSQTLWQNFMSVSPSLYSIYTHRQRLKDNIKNLNNQLLSSLNKVNGCSNDKLLLLFQRDFPIDESEINYHQLDFMMCKDSKKLMATLNSGDFLLVTDMQKDEIFKSTIDALTNLRKINLISTLNAKRCYPLVGGITDYKAYLYQVN